MTESLEQDESNSSISQSGYDGPRSASAGAELSASERHELECLRHQVGQLEYPCSPHCEGYLRELAMRNGGSRGVATASPIGEQSGELDEQ